MKERNKERYLKLFLFGVVFEIFKEGITHIIKA